MARRPFDFSLQYLMFIRLCSTTAEVVEGLKILGGREGSNNLIEEVLLLENVWNKNYCF